MRNRILYPILVFWDMTNRLVDRLLKFWRNSHVRRLKTSDVTEQKKKQKQASWPESASELYQPSDRRLSAKLVPTFADIGCHVVSTTVPYGLILGFLDRSRYFFFK
jgi:hypothetical protein